ncbi:RNA polymerase sigma factor SigI [Gottschalkia purinilytica]|uniref:RNA polymerase sigma factor SigI n=1 Tax=Gottschalkia purinilytica TaxID=1503 RepID=A0A0L0W8V7_GOTPU|nr:sigma-70 family RNA polymerase sigma factor [Gottschalkia purinilytica]KNF07740.1 RNA polymerase sigma factor SigI [Gottschalkia purinilytica]
MIDDNNRDEFIEENKQFIYSAASSVCKKKLSWENDDELSIAMIAFNSACDKYNKNKGNFLSFAKVLIRNSLIDFFRKSKSYVSLNFSFNKSDNDEKINNIQDKISISEYDKQIENSKRASEISQLSKELLQYNLNFSDLIKSSPSHKNTRNALLNIAFICIQEVHIIEYIKTKKMLPIKELMLITGNNRKYFEKWRRYLIVLIVILSSEEYPYIKSYLKIKVGEKNEN